MFKKLLKLEHKHKNLLFFLLGITLAYFLSQSQAFQGILSHLGNLGFLGVFLAGMMFASTFTVVTGGLILLTLAKTMSPFILIIFGVLGAITTDFLIFYFVKDTVVKEVTPIYDKVTGSHLKKILHTKYFAWTLPVLGAFIIASPLPDELGVSLLGLEQMVMGKFIFISVVSHTIGMTTLIMAARLI